MWPIQYNENCFNTSLKQPGVISIGNIFFECAIFGAIDTKIELSRGVCVVSLVFIISRGELNESNFKSKFRTPGVSS